MKTIWTIGLPALLLLALAPRPAVAWNWHPLWCYSCDCPPPPSVTFCYPPAGDPAEYPGGVPAWHWYGWGAARGGLAGVAEQLPQPKTERPPSSPSNSSGPPLSPPKQ